LEKTTAKTYKYMPVFAARK